MMASGYKHRVPPTTSALLDARLADVTKDWLEMTKLWVNADGDPFGFAALDERPAPDRFKEVFVLPRDATTITLASDGAVVSVDGQTGPRGTDDMIAAIEAVKIRDPLCVDLFPYWRGFLPGAMHLDDTSFFKIELG